MNNSAGSTRTYQICPKKEAAREETIISVYRELFGHSLPEGKQYWSMCSGHTNPDGTFSHGSELGQMLKEGLITVDQFHGVDIVEEIIQKNKNALPESNWHHGDFVRMMKKAYLQNSFNPAIINADFVSMSKKASVEVSDIIELLTYIKAKNVMVVSNIMYNNPYGDKRISKPLDTNPDEILEDYMKHNVFKSSWKEGEWNLYPDSYFYYGTGKDSRTVMMSSIFYKTN